MLQLAERVTALYCKASHLTCGDRNSCDKKWQNFSLLNAVICLFSSVDQEKSFFSTIHNGKMNFTEKKNTGGPP